MQAHRWIAAIIRQNRVKIRWLARIIGKLNLLRLQIRRRGLRMRNLYKYSTYAAITIGRNSRIEIWKCLLIEIYWWKSQILHNLSFGAQLISHQAIFRTDASETKLDATETIIETGLKEMYENSWNRNSKLTSSNWRKVAEILQGLQRFAASPRQNQ
ncbi:MAG: hypothetical protein EZS28_047164, partial [Streblomastix strix]